MDDTRLLYIDKSRTAQRLLENAVSVIAEIDCAASIQEATELLAANPYTFFIVDYELPDGDGLDLIRAIRADERHTQTPIILYTASLNNELEYQAMKAGANDSIAKPANMLELRERVAQLIALPAVKVVKRQLLQLTCFAWVSDGKFHEYSPDLNMLIEGECAERVREEMQTRLEETIPAKDDPSKYPAQTRMIRHVVNLVAEEQDQDASDQAA